MSEVIGTADVAIWRRRWFQWMVAVLAGCGIAAFVLPPIVGLIYAARSVLLPIVLALVLAYIFNPIVTWLHRRARMPRWFGTTVVMAAALAGLAIAVLLILPPMVEQAGTLVTRMRHEYPQMLLAKLDEASAGGRDAWLAQLDAGEWLTKATDALANLDWQKVYQFVVSSLDVGVGMAGAAISFTSYLALAALVTAFCFFFFSWKFNPICAWFVPFIPARFRGRTLEIIGQMDRSVAAFIRGRLIQAAVMAVVLSLGWAIAGVPGFLLLGLASGALNLVPFAAVIGFIAALGLNVIDDVSGGSASGGGFTWWTVLGPTLVYVAAQSLDGWVVEPVVQGKATDLDPVTVLLVVMLGGATAGLLGMLLAIPVAACVKILSKEVVLPKLRELAA